MKNFQITIILLSVFLISCMGKKKFSPAKIKIETVSINYDCSIKDVVRFDNKYLIQNDVYEEGIEFVLLNDNFKRDKKYVHHLNQKDFEFRSIWVNGDTIFGNRFIGTVYDEMLMYQIYYFTSKTLKWNLISEKQILAKNYSSGDLDIPFYEDGKYKVRAVSAGEFGGAVYFLNKKTHKTFSCPSMSTKNVFKMENCYYILSSLPHMTGSTQLLKIADPEKMYKIKTKNQLENPSWYYNEKTEKYIGGCFDGVETIIDTFSILTTASFVKDNTIYCIYSDGKKTFLGFVRNDKIYKIKKIIDNVTYYGKIRNIKSNKNIFPTRSREISGFYVIQDSVIKIIKLK